MKKNTNVLDCGTSTTRFGFSGDLAPTNIPTVVGHLRNLNAVLIPPLLKHFYFGEEAIKKRSILMMKKPIEGGFVTRYDMLEKFLEYIFQEQLMIKKGENPILLAETPLTVKSSREQLTQMMFETFNVPALYFCNSGSLSLFAVGKSTGLVLNSGLDVTYSIPVYEGHCLQKAVRRMRLGGDHITEYLANLLNQPIFLSHVLYQDIKEKVAYCSINLEKERQIESNSVVMTEDLKRIRETVGGFNFKLFVLVREYFPDSVFGKNYLPLDMFRLLMQDCSQHVMFTPTQYKLPDDQLLLIGKQQFECTEPFFQPSLASISGPGVHFHVKDSIFESPQQIQQSLSENIHVTGGGMLFPGSLNRLASELAPLMNIPFSIQGLSGQACRDQQWVGGSILSQLSTFYSDLCFDKSSYDEYGPSLIHSKVF